MPCRKLALIAFVTLTLSWPAAGRELRVCADPDNLPFSKEDGRGFENRIAELVARHLGAELTYYWLPDRRGFLRKTLNAHMCDVVMGLPEQAQHALTTPAYYRGTYVLVYRRDHVRALRSLDDARLARLRIGLALVGDDAALTPPAAALARRGIVDNVVGFPMFGEKPVGERIVAAVVDGRIDVGVLWGAQAGYFARRAHPRVAVVPIAPIDGIASTFAIAMGVRRDDVALRRDLARTIAEIEPQIEAVLDSYAVARVGR